MTVETTPRLIGDELRNLLRLAKEADSIELKLTVPELAYRSTAAALGLDPLDAQIRQVFFFDTPELTLNNAGLVARARRIQGKDSDSVVKLRPVVPDQLPAGVRSSPNFVVEVDAMPGGYVCSGSMKGTLSPTAVRPSISGEQAAAPAVLQGATSVLRGPRARWDRPRRPLRARADLRPQAEGRSPTTFSRRLVVEMWLYPDGGRVVELSTKCLPGEGLDVAEEARSFLESKGVESTGEQQTKTKTALEFFSAELQAARERMTGDAVPTSEKRKWDGTVSSVGPARLVAAPGDAVAWYVAAGSERQHPSKNSTERVASHELWVAVPGEWWVLCGAGRRDRRHRRLRAPRRGSVRATERRSDPLDRSRPRLRGQRRRVALEDEAQFHAHARTMSYPDEVVRGAWSGISGLAPRYTTGEWPFDGWMGRVSRCRSRRQPDDRT